MTTVVKTLDPSVPITTGKGPLATVYAIGRQILEKRRPEEVLQTIAQAVVEQLQPDHFCILSVTPEGGYLPLESHNLTLMGAVDSWPLSHTALQQAHSSGLAVLSFDTSTDASLQSATSVNKLRITSVLCVPFGAPPNRGIVYADLRQRRRSFQTIHLEFLTAVSIYAGLALEHLRRLEHTTQLLNAAGEKIKLLREELLSHSIVGTSVQLLDAFDQLRRLARAGARVLLRGETGTGKELFARAYAAHVARADGPYVPIAIPAIAPTLVESELFGHARGAFTEASRDKKGRLELGHGGVLFLDEVGDIDLPLQAKLLRFLDSGEIYRVGENQARHVDALVVSATNRPLEALVSEGRFRADLLARLGHVVRIPALRERREDVPLLVDHFVQHYGGRDRAKPFDPETVEVLCNYDWPLNIRQLQQVVEWAMCMANGDTIHPSDLPDRLRSSTATSTWSDGSFAESGVPRPLREVLSEVERHQIMKALEYTKGNKRRAIAILKISSDRFYKRLRRFGLPSRADRVGT